GVSRGCCGRDAERRDVRSHAERGNEDLPRHFFFACFSTSAHQLRTRWMGVSGCFGRFGGRGRPRPDGPPPGPPPPPGPAAAAAAAAAGFFFRSKRRSARPPRPGGMKENPHPPPPLPHHTPKTPPPSHHP